MSIADTLGKTYCTCSTVERTIEFSYLCILSRYGARDFFMDFFQCDNSHPLAAKTSFEMHFNVKYGIAHQMICQLKNRYQFVFTPLLCWINKKRTSKQINKIPPESNE